MIQLHNVQKYYNKNKSNELHVLKNVSLEFETKGLVVLLGPSGSGKTTLLNVLGGLDSTHSGQLDVMEQTFKGYDRKKWDSLRAIDIGVIFQSYNLIESETVYENIAMPLRMLGYKDETVIEARIMTLLKSVKMERFHKRRANQLSGGQQQRVAIARALVKKPKLLLTDEPTGNLDSKNTYDVMRLLRKIADQTLVIMVTHEETLASQFADRILRLEDGFIKNDEVNHPETAFSHSFDGDIYLGDFAHQDALDSKDQSIQLYTDKPLENPLNITLVLDQNTLYVKVNQETIKKVVQLENESDTQLKPGKRKEATVDTTESFDLTHLDAFEKKSDIKNVLDVKNTIRLTLQSLAKSSRGMKFLYAGFILTGALIALALGFLNNIIGIDEASVITYPEETIEVEKVALGDYDRVETLQEAFGASFEPIIRQESSYDLILFPLYQANQNVFGYGQFLNVNQLSASDISVGRLPRTDDEIVLDQIQVNTLLNNNTVIAYGVRNPETFLELEVQVQGGLYTIVGLSDGIADGIFMTNASLLKTLDGLRSTVSIYDAVVSDITHSTGVRPEASNEALIHETMASGTLPATIDIGLETFTVIGTYQSDSVFSPVVSFLGSQRVAYASVLATEPVYLLSADGDALRNHLTGENIPSERALDLAVDNQRTNNIQGSIGLLVFTLIALGASGLSFYFIIRSSLIERIREIGVYRSLGIRSFDIMKLFIVEAVLISTLTSIIGFLGLSYVLNDIQQTTQNIIEVISVSWLSLSVGVLFIYTVNIISGLLPVYSLLRKTPSMILSKYDI